MRPTQVYFGAAEVIFLKPLYSAAIAILTNPGSVYTPGSWVASCNAISIKLAGAYTQFNRLQSTMGVRMAANIVSLLAGALEAQGKSAKAKIYPFTIKSDAKGNEGYNTDANAFGYYIAHILTSVTSPSISPEAKALPSDLLTLNKEVALELSTYVNQGRGTPLQGREVSTVINMLTTITLALRKLRETPALHDDILPFAYALLTYLRITETDDAYDSFFTPKGLSSSDNQTVASVMIAMENIALSYARFAQTQNTNSLYFATELLSDYQEFVGRLASDRLVQHYDKAINQLNEVKAMVAKIALPSEAEYSASFVDYVRKFGDVEFMIPMVVKDIIMRDNGKGKNEPLAAFAPQPTPDKYYANFKGFLDDPYQQSAITFDEGYQFYQYFISSAFSLYRMTKSLSDWYSKFTTTFRSEGGMLTSLVRDFLPPIDVDLPLDVTMGSENFTYFSPFVRQAFPAAVPKYKVDKEGNQTPYFAADVYKILRVDAFIGDADIIATYKDAWAWPHDIKIPTTSTMATDFATLPIPFNYMATSLDGSRDNRINDVRALMAYAPDRIASELTDWFFPILTAMRTNTDRRKAIADAIAGLCIVYEKTGTTKEGNETWSPIMPSLYTIYGVPVKAFIKANEPQFGSTKTVIYNTDRTLALALNTRVPKCGRLAQIPTSMAANVFVTQPILVKYFNHLIIKDAEWVKLRHQLYGTTEGQPSIGEFAPDWEDSRDALNALMGTMYSKIRNEADHTLVEWETVMGWSTVFAAYPHVFFTNAFTHSADSLSSAVTGLRTTRNIGNDVGVLYGNIIATQRAELIMLDIFDIIHSTMTDDPAPIANYLPAHAKVLGGLG